MALSKSLINEMRTRVVIYRKVRETAADGQEVASSLRLVGAALAKVEPLSATAETFLGDIHSVPRTYRITMWRFPIAIDDVVSIPEFNLQMEVAQISEDTKTVTVVATERKND
jgi:hypothetical protein